MPACKQCGTLQMPQQIATNKGNCTRCKQRCCIECGCTNTRPCFRLMGREHEREEVACEWLEEMPDQPWRGLVCNYCLQKKAAELYNEVNRKAKGVIKNES